MTMLSKIKKKKKSKIVDFFKILEYFQKYIFLFIKNESLWNSYCKSVFQNLTENCGNASMWLNIIKYLKTALKIKIIYFRKKCIV